MAEPVYDPVDAWAKEATKQRRRAEAAEAEVAKLREALERLVADYQDVPDPTDADGQAVFEQARLALQENSDND